MPEDVFIEIEAQQVSHTGERICGDVFRKKKISEEARIIAVLSDGMGHGVKANMLATLTATMAMNFTIEHRNPETIAEIIMNTLPVCSKRKLSYATFSIIDVEINGKAHILEYDNPEAVIFRNEQLLPVKWQEIIMSSEKHKGKKLRYYTFTPKLGDRIFIFSDGITQSGMGSDRYPFGWGNKNLRNFIANTVHNEPDISAEKLAGKIVNKAVQHDAYKSKDDTSCASVYFRKPRKLLIITGPPIDPAQDAELAKKAEAYNGKKIICGGSTIDIMARELNIEVTDSLDIIDSDLPPLSYLKGFDLATEGILTLNKTGEILETLTKNDKPGKGPADLLVKYLLDSDKIDFIVGTKINEAHQDPNVPVDLDIRRTAVKRIAGILKEKYLKEINIEFI